MKITKEELEKLKNKEKNLKQQIERIEEEAKRKTAVITGRLMEVQELISRVKIEEEEN